MRRPIPSQSHDTPGKPVDLTGSFDDFELSIRPADLRCEVSAVVAVGDQLKKGAELARGESLCVHAPASGTVTHVDDDCIRLKADHLADVAYSPDLNLDTITAEDLPDFAAKMGLAGMGGSVFPGAIKLKASGNVDTLLINAVECEPGIEIDEALWFHEAESVKAAIAMLRGALPLKHVVIATKRASVERLRPSAAACSCEILAMSNQYPAGAEKLIVAKWRKRMPATGQLPFHLGCLVMSVASLDAIGKRLLSGQPLIERPLTIVDLDERARNVTVPMGVKISSVLDELKISMTDPEVFVISGGMMMGKAVSPETRIHKGTNALILRRETHRLTKHEDPCTLCGSCFDACPLGLHPIGMAERIQEQSYSKSLNAQLNECFLCGACSAVCPSDIPLVQYFHEGKQWIRNRK